MLHDRVQMLLVSMFFWSVELPSPTMPGTCSSFNHAIDILYTNKVLFMDFLTIGDGTDTLSRNVGKGLPLDAALYPRRAQISSASRRKPELTKQSKRRYPYAPAKGVKNDHVCENTNERKILVFSLFRPVLPGSCW
jgi:hypothetical protein